MDEADESPALRWEAERLDRARSGDRAAFAELYRRFAPRVFARVLYPKLGRRDAAEDALSETFRAVHEKLPDFQPRGVSVYHWIARIAANKALDLHRARASSGRALQSFEALLAPVAEAPPTPGELLELRVDDVRLRERLATALGRVNSRYRRALELRFLEEKSREEAAAELGVRLGTFDVVLLRALRALRREWESLTAEEATDDHP